MQIDERYKNVIGWFSANMPDAQTELHYSNAYELLVAVILSAQCTDKRVNQTTPALFAKYPTPQLLAQSSEDEILQLIKSCSFPNSKARHLLGMAQMLTTRFGGVVPSDIEQLQQMPGVGRKTANVIASVVYNKPAIAVDTHVFRVSARIGLTRNAKHPIDTEKQLTTHIKPELRAIAHHWLILHGRYICTARNPKCGKCGIAPFCITFEKNQKKQLNNETDTTPTEH